MSQRIARITGHISGAAAPTASLSTQDCAYFDTMKVAPPNAIFHTKTAYKNDPDSRKISLGIGAYRDSDGKPWVLPSVRAAEQRIAADHSLNHEYLGITGDAEFCDLAQKLCFGEDSEAVKSGRICSVQTLSGTGSLRVGLEFLAKFFPKATVYMSNPTWGNHKTIIGRVGLKMKYFSYWDAQKRCLDEPGMMRDLSGAQPGDIVLLHACAHNPTGVDPTQEQWHKIADIIKRKQLLTFFDTAYQGFASGNPDRDAYSIRYWTKMGMELVVSQSFAKNFGLYNERIGGFHVVTGSAHQAKAAKSQISLIIRPMYSNPPVHGARIVKAILGDKKLRAQWMSEMQEMSQRIDVCRKLLYKELTQLKTPGTWEHITSQIGMFSFTGLTKAQVAVMTKKHHVYMLSNGRISMAGVNKKNAAYLARAIDDVVRNVHQ